jgi:hypothetical protein
MIAYHFPPLAGSSGIQRTLRFVQHLPKFHWQPLVLSAHPRVYERTSSDLEADVPAGTIVRRAFALDTARHLAVAGRYIGSMARPDRWMSWQFDGVRQGTKLIKEFKPEVIWSTYPIATAHLIGAELHRRTGIPWIADFRDPMAQNGYPADPLTWARYKAIEQTAVLQARYSVFTTPGAASDYRQRYPEAADRIFVLENGYDEETFAASEREVPVPAPLNPGTITLLHSGIVYPTERDPTQLFLALHRLFASGRVTPQQLKLRFRAPVHDKLLNRLVTEFSLQGVIEVCPPIAYRDALLEMRSADALLVMQASNCNEQIPAKVYEYLRAGRPILCLADPDSDTARVLGYAGIRSAARLDSVDQIEAAIPPFLAAVNSGSAELAEAATTRAASRYFRTQALVDCFESALGDTPLMSRARATPTPPTRV